MPNCWAFLEYVVTASSAISMSASGGLEVRSPSAPRLYSIQDSGNIPAIASFVSPYLSRISCMLPPSWAMALDSESLPLIRSPIGPVKSARTSDRIPTCFQWRQTFASLPTMSALTLLLQASRIIFRNYSNFFTVALPPWVWGPLIFKFA